jgi:transposase InsO family protein
MSMTENNHRAENAIAERVNGILKQEYYLDANFTHKPEARRASVEGISLYNHRRPHTSLGFRTPAEVHDAKAKH